MIKVIEERNTRDDYIRKRIMEFYSSGLFLDFYKNRQVIDNKISDSDYILIYNYISLSFNISDDYVLWFSRYSFIHNLNPVIKIMSPKDNCLFKNKYDITFSEFLVIPEISNEIKEFLLFNIDLFR